MPIQGFVYVVESPNPMDLIENRMEGKALTKMLQLAHIPISYNLVTDVMTLELALGDRIFESINRIKKMPIVHISMHGDAEGVGLTNGIHIKWGKLREYLYPLMQIMGGALLVCMSSCMGGYGCIMAMGIEKGHTFWSLIGNSGSTSWAEGAVAYSSFYHLFFKGVDLDGCVEAMKVASGNHNYISCHGPTIKSNWNDFVRTNLDEILRTLSDRTFGK